jgi:hypothetical protein
MAAREVILNHQYEVMRELGDIVDRLDPEALGQVRSLLPAGMVPTSGRSLDELVLFLGQAVLVLAKRLDELEEANRPKKRGRPPKDRKQEAS